MTGEPRAAVLDSSAIIQAKRVIPPGRQWTFFEGLKAMVRRASSSIAGC